MTPTVLSTGHTPSPSDFEPSVAISSSDLSHSAAVDCGDEVEIWLAVFGVAKSAIFDCFLAEKYCNDWVSLTRLHATGESAILACFSAEKRCND